MKRMKLILGITVLSLCLAMPAFAGNYDRGDRGRRMKGPWQGRADVTQRNFGRFNNLTEAQLNQVKELRQNFIDRTADLRTQLIAKSAELNILFNITDPDIEKAKALQKELSSLQAKMDQERIDFLFELRKIYPDIKMGMHQGRGGNPRAGDPANMGKQPYMGNFGPSIF